MGLAQFARVGDIIADIEMFTLDELARRQRFRWPEDREAFDAAHTLVRHVAGAFLDIDPVALAIEQSCPSCAQPHGRPSVAGYPDLGVSMSHSRGHVAAAVAWGRCGVDVETLGSVRLVEAALSTRERTWVHAQPNSMKAFATLWVRKEALIKAGLGSINNTSSLEVLESNQPALRHDGLSFAEWSHSTAVGVAAYEISRTTRTE